MASRWPSFCSMRMPGGRLVSSLPLGPCTATVLPSILIVTPLGSSIGFFPIRDIRSAFSSQPPALACSFGKCLRPLPNLAEQFAAQALLAGLTPGHNALGRGQNVNAHAAQHTGNLRAAHVHAAAGTGDALDVRDRGFVVGAVLKIDAQQLV